MKKSIALATFMVIGAGATSVAALPNPYQGSDTLFNVTTQAIAAASLTPTGAYIGGGSGNGASAMANASLAAATQQTAPMSRMMKSESKICVGFNGGTTAGSTATNAAAVVIGLDAVDVLSATTAGGAAACNGTADATGTGLAYSGGSSFASGNAGQTWKWTLALVYGGLDLSNAAAGQDCNSTARHNIVANWSNLFQNSCANGSASVCGAGTAPNGALWHAYRRDDTSGTSDVFASILGLSPSTSNSSVNGFGASPYCNAMNWDNAAGNGNCAQGPHDQFTGPGGVLDPASTCNGSTCGAAGSGNHRMPPTGTWGTNPNASSASSNAYDVLPTQFQDNDPIRRTCIGSTTNNHNRAGEEVCNIDGALGLVLPMVDSDWIPKGNFGQQYPTNACTTFVVGKAAQVFTCANRGAGTKHSAECPNGDSLFGTGCLTPIDSTNNTSQCVATKSTVAALQVRSLGSPDGRIYNSQFRDGTTTDGSVGYVQYAIASLGTTTDFAAAYNRIHQVESLNGGSACQLVDMTDQIGCLAQADPCSIGYAGDGAKIWYTHSGACAANQAAGVACPTGPGADALRVAQTYPTVTTVQLLGKAGEYQFSRKLYFSSLVGFGNVADTTGDPTAADEITLAKFESTPADINPILTGNDFFTLGPLSPSGTDAQFCEDFNEQTVCGAATNHNGCSGNPSGIPTVSTICGNGTLDAFEECDPGATGISAVNAGSGGCSSTCRCKADFNESSGACN
jgi:hypothetical protein